MTTMKVNIERSDLLKAMGRAQSIVERRTTIPILANVLIEAEAETVRLRTTDLDIEVLDKVSAVVAKPGAITVAAHTLYEIVRKLPDGSLVQLTDDVSSGRVEILAGSSRFHLSTLPKGDFPVMASTEYASEFSIKAKTLKRLFDKSKFAMSTEETRYYLNGVYFHSIKLNETNLLRAVATDGHRLAQVDVNLPEEIHSFPGVIIPRKTVSELRIILEDGQSDIKVAISDTKIRFSNDFMTLTSKVIDGSFPDYTRVIPNDNFKKLEINAVEFSQAVDRVSTVSSERARAVKLSLSDDKLVLSVNAPENGTGEDEMFVSYKDEPLEIGFNAKYLQELASQVDQGTAVFLFNSSGDPAIMRQADDEMALYVVMPMRV